MGNHWAMRQKPPTQPVRAMAMGARPSHFTVRTSSSPGPTGRGSVTPTSVRSLGLPSSGDIGRQTASRSPCFTEVSSVQPHGSSQTSRKSSRSNRRNGTPRIQVVSSWEKALRYRCNGTDVIGAVQRLRQRISMDPWTVLTTGSRSTSIR